MNVGERMKARRKQLGISADDVAKKLGVSRSTIFRYEKGDIEKLPTNIMDDLSDILKTTPAYLMGWSDVPSMNNEIIDVSKLVNIVHELEPERKEKIYRFAEQQLNEQNGIVNLDKHSQNKKIVNGRSTAAGFPIDGDTEDKEASIMIIDQTEIPSDADEIVTIAGDSMEPDYPQGSQVFIHYQPEVEEGEIAIVAIKDEGVTCKKVYYDFDEKKIILESINEEYKDMVYPMDEIRVIGKVL
ncbi:helix-turn-helix domain-containing protein [Candidatus Enterococcus clewellii]|uniref:HTH cro/C1-type domain-containing protein n=1 Tax=Candidatus Enterococcus clewellii TaxID=1834193 RepID=A0A242K441_9ENTE|nr:XRE family transcriptional regulator [Enterococcus sp. 9E7_DIV0242]OTP13683.1 hypothetical protein A5888_003161 [Enterococcus sp. 9E7_DIV0242]